MSNIFYHKRSCIVVDLDKDTKEFLITNEKKYKTINIILNNINEDIYRNISTILEELNNKIVVTSLSVLTDKFAKNIYELNKKKILVNRNRKLILANGHKKTIFEDDLIGIKKIEFIKDEMISQNYFIRDFLTISKNSFK